MNIRRKLAQILVPNLEALESAHEKLPRLQEHERWLVEARMAFRDADHVFRNSKNVAERRAARDKLHKALRLHLNLIFAAEIIATTVVTSKINSDHIQDPSQK